ncbi:MAG: DEAD/DEAH box helicase [Synechocystis sp.]|nr:DEAD/DEAH box helicase [Synechocystis sp.]
MSNASSPIHLRDYQRKMIDDISLTWECHKCRKKVMAQLPTGGGKTVIFSAIADKFVRRQERVLVLAHREELVVQAANKLTDITRSPVGIIKAGYSPDPLFPIQVASVQSMVNRLTHHPNFDLVVIDEAHHSTASTYRKILEAYPNAYQLGVTATPIRTDGTGFRDLFDAMVCGPTIAELIAQGYLADFTLYADPSPMNTKGVKTMGGDFSARDLAKKNDIMQLSGNVVDSYRRHADGKRCLVFALNVAHSKAIADRYNAAGIPAVHLDGDTPNEERKEALRLFAEGKIKVITNCSLFAEGLDIPAIDAVQIARPTKSLGLWLQIIGRALRLALGKSKAIIIDHTNNSKMHGLPTRRRIWTLDGVEYPDEAKKPKRKPQEDTEVEPVEVVEAPVQLVAIAEPTEEEQWLTWLQDLITFAKNRKYSDGWVYHKLMEEKPPLFVFQAYGKLKGYKPAWAIYKYQEAHGIAA